MGGTIFGVGPLEILAIAILVLLVFGPDRLPDLMRQAGQAVKSARRYIEGFTSDFRKEVAPFAKDIDDATRALREDIATIREATDIRALIQPIDLAGGSDPKPVASKELPQSTDSPFSAQVANATAELTQSTDSPFSAQVANATAEPTAEPPKPVLNFLSADNPWSTGEAPTPAAAALDEDNPWRS